MGLDYLCHAKKGRDGLGHQCSKTLTGHRAQPEFAKKGTLRIVPQYSWLFSDKAADTVQLTHPILKHYTLFLRLYLYFNQFPTFMVEPHWDIVNNIFKSSIYILCTDSWPKSYFYIFKSEVC